MSDKQPKEGRINKIPPQLSNCVGFVGLESSSPNWRGTFYAVNAHDKAHYLVTAAHNVHKARSKNEPLLLRFREVDGKARTIKISNDAWTIPNDRVTDVAVLSPTVSEWTPGSGQSTWAIPVNMFATHDRIESYGVVPGDQVLISGLYYRAPGTSVNEPIMRAGIVASLPNRQIRAPLLGGDLEAHLVELHSIGGHSGSPVFWKAGLIGMGYGDHHSYLLLGTLHGHFEFTGASDAELDELKRVNEGIGIVESADSIVSALNHADLCAERRKWIGHEFEIVLPDRMSKRIDA